MIKNYGQEAIFQMNLSMNLTNLFEMTCTVRNLNLQIIFLNSNAIFNSLNKKLKQTYNSYIPNY